MISAIIKKFLFINIVFLLAVNTINAQENKFLSSGDSDPEATKLLKNVLDEIEAIKMYELKFGFSFSNPDGTGTEQNGTIRSSENKYRLELGDQLIIQDGNYVWYYLKDRNEVQINDLDENPANSLSPNYFLNFYQNEEYVYAITNEYTNKQGHKIVRIDFKPIGKFSEYKKIGIDLNINSNRPVSLLILNSDGSRMRFTDLNLKSIVSDKQDFIFDLSKYPGIRIEDLRLD